MLSDPTTFYVMKKFEYICITHVVFFFILPSEFQVIISGSKKQQQKDSYQSELPFSVILGRTPQKQRVTRKQFTNYCKDKKAHHVYFIVASKRIFPDFEFVSR